jgi:dihydrofolate reductase
MRKLIATFFTSLDGIVDAPQEWHFPYMTPEIIDSIVSTFDETDSLLLGRVTFQEWQAYWSHQPSDGGMADFINSTRKYVASTTLDSVSWQGSELLAGDVSDAVRELKSQPGGTILVNGSGTLVRHLLLDGLVDELRVVMHPVVVGTGKHLFEEGGSPVGLKLVDVQQFTAGGIGLTYGLPQEEQ